MERYTPEIIAMLCNSARNVTLICGVAYMVVALFRESHSWHALWPLAALLLLGNVTFIRD